MLDSYAILLILYSCECCTISSENKICYSRIISQNSYHEIFIKKGKGKLPCSGGGSDWSWDASPRTITLKIPFWIFPRISRHIAESRIVYLYICKIHSSERKSSRTTQPTNIPYSRCSNRFDIIVPLSVCGNHETKKAQRVTLLEISISQAKKKKSSSLGRLKKKQYGIILIPE